MSSCCLCATSIAMANAHSTCPWKLSKLQGGSHCRLHLAMQQSAEQRPPMLLPEHITLEPVHTPKISCARVQKVASLRMRESAKGIAGPQEVLLTQGHRYLEHLPHCCIMSGLRIWNSHILAHQL